MKSKIFDGLKLSQEDGVPNLTFTSAGGSTYTIPLLRIAEKNTMVEAILRSWAHHNTLKSPESKPSQTRYIATHESAIRFKTVREVDQFIEQQPRPEGWAIAVVGGPDHEDGPEFEGWAERSKGGQKHCRICDQNVPSRVYCDAYDRCDGCITKVLEADVRAGLSASVVGVDLASGPDKSATMEFSPPHKSVLVEAEGLVHGDRNADYGHPLDDFTRTAKIWGAILGVPISPKQVGLCMCGVKISRECNKSKRDNMVDLAGYAETVAWAIDEQDRRDDLTTTFGPIEETLG